MAAGASQFTALPGGIKLSPDGMVVPETVPAEDVSAAVLIRMAAHTEGREQLVQERRGIRSVRIVAGQTGPSGHRRMDVRLCEIRLVMTLIAELRDRRRERKLRLLRGMRGPVAGRTALFHASELADRGMDHPFRRKLFMAINA